MATIKLEDLLGKKKEAPQVLDLSHSIVQSREEFQRLLDKVPEYKIRPEKVSCFRKNYFTFCKQKLSYRWVLIWIRDKRDTMKM
jgi:hypothetical protein